MIEPLGDAWKEWEEEQARTNPLGWLWDLRAAMLYSALAVNPRRLHEAIIRRVNDKLGFSNCTDLMIVETARCIRCGRDILLLGRRDCGDVCQSCDPIPMERDAFGEHLSRIIVGFDPGILVVQPRGHGKKTAFELMTSEQVDSKCDDG